MRKLALYTLSFIVLLIIYTFIIFFKKIDYREVVFNNDSDGIAVLTGGKGRISLGLNLFSENTNLQLIISGVDKQVSIDTIVPVDLKNRANITIDKVSESTIQNAKVVSKWTTKHKLQKITIITSYYHMPRSMFLMQSLAPGVNFYPYPVRRFFSGKTSIKEDMFYYFFLTEEYIKYLVSHFIIFIK